MVGWLGGFWRGIVWRDNGMARAWLARRGARIIIMARRENPATRSMASIMTLSTQRCAARLNNINDKSSYR